jgi:hypothetical protein
MATGYLPAAKSSIPWEESEPTYVGNTLFVILYQDSELPGPYRGPKSLEALANARAGAGSPDLVVDFLRTVFGLTKSNAALMPMRFRIEIGNAPSCERELPLLGASGGTPPVEQH